MPRTCTVCTHPRRSAIDSALVAGESYRAIGKRFGACPASVFRHKREHIPTAMVKAHDAAEITRADTLLDRVRALCIRSENLLSESESILADARKSKQTADALAAIKTAAIAARELRSQFELLGTLSGELNKQVPPVSIDARGGRFIVLPSVADPAPQLGPPTVQNVVGGAVQNVAPAVPRITDRR